jgi:AcrR family transcriptional regulator
MMLLVAIASESPAPSRFDRQRARTHQAIVETAVTLFAKRGIRQTTIEDICDAADVAQRTFFNHFPTREHLYEAIAAHRIEEFAALLARFGDDARPIEVRLPDLFGTIGRGMVARPAYRELLGAMLNSRPSGEGATARGGLLASASLAFVEGGVERGEINPEHGTDVLADLLLGALVMAIANWKTNAGFDLEGELLRSAGALADLFTRAVDPGRKAVEQ